MPSKKTYTIPFSEISEKNKKTLQNLNHVPSINELYNLWSEKLQKIIENIIYKKHKDQYFTKITTTQRLLFILINMPDFKRIQNYESISNSQRKVGLFDSLSIYTSYEKTKSSDETIIFSRDPIGERNFKIRCVFDVEQKYLEKLTLIFKDLK